MGYRVIDTQNTDKLDELCLNCACLGKHMRGFAILLSGDRVEFSDVSKNLVDGRMFHQHGPLFDIGVLASSYRVLRQAIRGQHDLYIHTLQQSHMFQFVTAIEELDDHADRMFIPLSWVSSLYLYTGSNGNGGSAS